MVGLEDELKGVVPLALCVLKNGETCVGDGGFEPRFTTCCCCRRRAEEPRDLRRDRKAGEEHGRTRGRSEESAFRPGVTQDALRQDPPLLSRQPGQRETLQGRSVSTRPAC